MHPLPRADRSVATPGSGRPAVQDAGPNSCQSQVTVRLISGEPYFLWLPKDPAGQCVCVSPSLPIKLIAHTQDLHGMSRPGYKLRAVSCGFCFLAHLALV